MANYPGAIDSAASRSLAAAATGTTHGPREAYPLHLATLPATTSLAAGSIDADVAVSRAPGPHRQTTAESTDTSVPVMQ